MVLICKVFPSLCGEPHEVIALSLKEILGPEVESYYLPGSGIANL